MGQPIPHELRHMIEATGNVREITGEHIILNCGVTIDPNEFVVTEQRRRFVLKLLRCGCFLGGHRVGTHTTIPGWLLVYADGSRKPNYQLPAKCPRGDWILEEVVREPARGDLKWIGDLFDH